MDQSLEKQLLVSIIGLGKFVGANIYIDIAIQPTLIAQSDSVAAAKVNHLISSHAHVL